jgi:hypothetical protein
MFIRRLSLAITLCALLASAASAAENLHMREGISFFHDLDQGFPILCDKMDDVALASGKPSLLFFGASGDLNTNRQAKRIVDLYRKYKDSQVKFIVIDVDHASAAPVKALVKSYYPGYIPAEVIFDKQGKPKWNHTGEVDAGVMGGQLDKLL